MPNPAEGAPAKQPEQNEPVNKVFIERDPDSFTVEEAMHAATVLALELGLSSPLLRETDCDDEIGQIFLDTEHLSDDQRVGIEEKFTDLLDKEVASREGRAEE